MGRKIRTYLDEGNLYYGLEITEHHKEVIFHLCEIRKKGKVLFITNISSHSSLSTISNSIKKNAPLILTINTSNVITKIADTSVLKNSEAMVHDQFPNLDFSTFYYELIQNKSVNLVSIIKKEKIQHYLNEFSTLKIKVCKIVLGISAIRSITDYLTSDTLYISNNKLEFENKILKKNNPFSREKSMEVPSYELNDLTLSSNSILGFASVLSFMSKNNESSTNFTDTQLLLESDFRNNRYFDLFFKISLASILALLLINFFVFNYYFEEVNSLQTMASFNKSNKKMLLELKYEVQKKQSRVEAILSSANSKTSFFLDEIGNSIPNSIQLSEIKYQPLLKPIRDLKPVEIDKNIILILGSSNNSQDFSKWIQSIETLNWVKQAQTLDYDYENITNSNFSIKLTVYEK